MNKKQRVFSDAEIEANKKIYTEHFDPEFTEDLVSHVLSLIDRFYFRSKFIGFDNLPERNNPDRPLIYAANHCGMAFPWDAIIFSAMLFKRNKFNFKHSVRPLASPLLSQINLMNPFLLTNFWRRAGGIDATFLNFETMMQYQEANLLIYPEGIPGIGKGFNRRYQLQRFATSFIRMSIKYRTDVVPYASVNGEYINPYNLESKLLNRLTSLIGIPFLPIGIMTLLIPLQPWLFYFGFPAKLTFVMGERIKPYAMIDKPYEEISDDEFQEVAERVKDQMQANLDAAVAKYGQQPYQCRELFASWKGKLSRFPFFIPAFWPSIFAEFERFSKKGRVRSLKINFWTGLRAFLKNPITIAFFIPILGWIPILLRGYSSKRADLDK